METIRLMTWINAPVERCFKLSTSIDLHIASAASTKEEAIAGVTTGLIGQGQKVTWQGYHFGRKVRHTSQIDIWRPYFHFRDIMVEGVFLHYEHDHFFATMDDGTRMRDEVRFAAPWGVLGKIATKMAVRKHLCAMLVRRNATIKRIAESEQWHKYLDGHTIIKPVLTGAGPAMVDGWEKMKLV